MNATIYRQIDGDMPTVVRGRGSVLTMSDGRDLVDMSSGALTASLGHDNQFVLAAMQNQAAAIPNVFGGFWKSEASEAAGEEVCTEFERSAPGWFGGVIFQQGGGEAVDFACRVASQFHLEHGQTPRVRIAARQHCYHGVGLLPSALSGDYPRYALMEAHKNYVKKQVVRLPHPIDSLTALDQTRKILQVNPLIGAVIIEPVGGPPIGAWPDEVEYLRGLRDICDEFGVLLIFDEILCGSGRCGDISVAAIHGVWPDIIVLGKGLSAGYQPVSAIVLSEKVVDRIRKGSGSLSFGTAFGAHSIGCAAVAATLQYMRQNDVFALTRNSQWFEGALRRTLEGVACVGDIRGMGLLWGIRLINYQNGRLYPPSIQAHVMARKAILDAGAVVYSKGGTMHGQEDFLIVAPPLTVNLVEVSNGLERIRDGLERFQNVLASNS